MPFIVATYVSACSQGQCSHSARTNTTPGDFGELVKGHLEKYNIDYDEEFIRVSKEEDFKSFLRNKIRENSKENRCLIQK